MGNIIYGKDVAADLKETLKTRIAELYSRKLTPTLCMIAVGDDTANASYERGIVKCFDELNIDHKKVCLPENITQEEFEKEFNEINSDSSINGILLFRPLPSGLSYDFAKTAINPLKDIDCMSNTNWAKLCMGETDGFYPCTAEAVIAFLEHEKINCYGKNVVVIGRSAVIGRPLVSMLISRRATVTCCNTSTRDIAERCTNADIIVSAAGSAGLVTKEHLQFASKDCVVIDVGINAKPNGEKGICGDCLFDEILPVCGSITPVPGGVGAVTSSILAEHVIRACEMQNKR